jgi:hypothetical protein
MIQRKKMVLLANKEDEEQYQIKISNRFMALENSDDTVDINRA